MGEIALKLVTPGEEVGREVVSVEAQARDLRVVDSATYIKAGELWKAIKALRVKVANAFDGNIKKAHELHKGLVAEKKRHDGPLDEAERMVKRGMSDFDLEQEKIRQAEQRRLEEIARKAEEAARKAELDRLEVARKEEEDRLIAAATAAEAAGDRQRAEDITAAAIAVTEEAKQEAAAVMAEPVYVPPVVIPKTVPKMQGGPVYRTIWKFRIKDVNAIPRQHMIPNEVSIGQVVRALKGQHGIAGIEAYEERC